MIKYIVEFFITDWVPILEFDHLHEALFYAEERIKNSEFDYRILRKETSVIREFKKEINVCNS